MRSSSHAPSRSAFPARGSPLFSKARAAALCELLRGDHEELIALAAAADGAPARLLALRQAHERELVEAAVEVARARRKAAGKLADLAAPLIADAEAVEQASSSVVARHKAARFAALAPRRIVDLCCGLGADAHALARVAPVLAVDREPARARMAARHAACSAAVARVEDLRLSGEALHLDPSRRKDGRRLHAYEDMEPGPEFIERCLAACPDMALKLSPAVDIDALPIARGREVEVIAEGSGLVQAVLWGGRLARGANLRTATLLPSGASMSGRPEILPPGAVGAFVHAVHPAAERAGLMGALARKHGLWAHHEALGLLSGAAAVSDPFLTPFRVLEEGPFQEKRLRASLRAHGAGVVEVKTRGKAADPDVLAPRLRGDGTVPLTVFILREGKALRSILAARMA